MMSATDTEMSAAHGEQYRGQGPAHRCVVAVGHGNVNIITMN